MRDRDRLSARTLETYEREVRRYFGLFKTEFRRDPRTATVSQITEYVRRVAPAHIQSDSSLSVHVAALKHWYLGNHGRPIELPSLPPRQLPVPDMIERSQLHALFRHTRAHPCGKMLRLICSGARLSEVVQMRVRDVDSANSTMDLRDADGQVWRQSAVPASMKYELQHEMHGKGPDEFLFAIRQANGQWQPVSPRTVQHFLASAGKQLGIVKLTAQSLRETLVLRLLRWGLDSRRIANLIGVKNQKSITRLRQFLPDPCHGIVDRLDA